MEDHVNFATPECFYYLKNKYIKNKPHLYELTSRFFEAVDPKDRDFAITVIDQELLDTNEEFRHKILNGPYVDTFCKDLRNEEKISAFCSRCKCFVEAEEIRLRRNYEYNVLSRFIFTNDTERSSCVSELKHVNFLDTYAYENQICFYAREIINLLNEGMVWSEIKTNLSKRYKKELRMQLKDLFLKIDEIPASKKQYSLGLQYLKESDERLEEKLESKRWLELFNDERLEKSKDDYSKKGKKEKCEKKNNSIDLLSNLVKEVPPLLANIENNETVESKKEDIPSEKKKSSESTQRYESNASQSRSCNTEETEAESVSSRLKKSLSKPSTIIIDSNYDQIRKELTCASHISIEYLPDKGIILLCVFSFDKVSPIYQLNGSSNKAVGVLMPTLGDESIIKMTSNSLCTISYIKKINIDIKSWFCIDLAYSCVNYEKENKCREDILKETTGLVIDCDQDSLDRLVCGMDKYKSVYHLFNRKLLNAVTFAQLNIEQKARYVNVTRQGLQSISSIHAHFILDSKNALSSDTNEIVNCCFSNIEELFKNAKYSAMGVELDRFEEDNKLVVFNRDLYRRILVESYEVRLHLKCDFVVIQADEKGLQFGIISNKVIFNDMIHHIMRHVSRELASKVEPEILVTCVGK